MPMRGRMRNKHVGLRNKHVGLRNISQTALYVNTKGGEFAKRLQLYQPRTVYKRSQTRYNIIIKITRGYRVSGGRKRAIIKRFNREKNLECEKSNRINASETLRKDWHIRKVSEPNRMWKASAKHRGGRENMRGAMYFRGSIAFLEPSYNSK